jgi:lipoprotein NlpI
MSLDARAHWRLGNAHSATRSWQAALESYAAAIAQNPSLVEAHLNRGNVLQALERWSEALEAYDQVLRLQSEDAVALSNRGIVLKELHRFDEALEAFDRAIARDPTNITARYNRGLAALLLGQLARGFDDYEARWHDPHGSLYVARRELAAPRWSGREPLEGRRILLHAEQGYGDTLQFCRYVPLLAAQGAEVLLEVPTALVALLADLEGVARIVAAGRTLPPFDCHCPLMSLPLALRTTLATIPGRIPYLRAEPAKVEAWSARLAVVPRPWVGLAWAGSPVHRNDHNRSIALRELLAELPGALRYVSLQKGVPASDRHALDGQQMLDWTDDLHDFSDTAALVHALDLVISVDTSTVHLAGSLGRPCWVMLPFHPDWRWLLDRDDSPWYPTLRLFRQERRGDWAGVVARVAEALRQRNG